MANTELEHPKYIDTPRGRFAYLEAGSPDAPLVLCLHGFPDHAHTWMHLLPQLANAGFHAVAPWLRGYAPSCLDGPFNLETLRDDILALNQAMASNQPSMLIGHDWGAAITCAAIAKAPMAFQRAITLAVPHALNFLQRGFVSRTQLRRSRYILLFQLPGVSDAMVRRNDFNYIDTLWKRWSPGLDIDTAFHRELKLCLRQSMPAPLEYYRAMTRPVGPALQRLMDPQRAERAIAVPTLHLHGQSDGCVGPECLEGQTRFFSGEFREVVLPGLGHFLHLEDPERVGQLAIDWLSSH